MRELIVDVKGHEYLMSTDGLITDFYLLEKGSIKKLIGRELTWGDGPVELKE